MSNSTKHDYGRLIVACLGLVLVVGLVYVLSSGANTPIRIYADSQPQAIRWGRIGSIYAGQALTKTCEVVNATKDDVQISLKTSCKCTHSSIEPTKILAGHKAILTVTFDSRDAPRDRTETRSLELMLKAVPETAGPQKPSCEYRIALDGQVEVRSALTITEIVSFDRQTPLEGKGLTKAIHVVNHALEPVKVTWTPNASAAFLLPSTREVLLPVEGKAELPVVLTERWSGKKTEQEQLTFTFGIGKSSWSENVRLVVYPRLRYRAEPPALLLGQLREHGDDIQRDIQIVQGDGQPCRQVRILSYDPNTLFVSLRENGRITAGVKPSHWGQATRRNITLACGLEPNDATLEIPVVAYMPTAQSPVQSP